ncbi:hypothetical protein CR513_60165, partial [Mucuna pruriens]
MKDALMWTINDFPAYGMLFSWTITGRLGCPIDCHCQFLPSNHPYRISKNSFKKRCVETSPPPPTYLLCHNIDVIHIEKNVFMKLFDTMMNINGRTKDIYKAQMDIAEICNQKELKLKDIATHALTKSQRVTLCKWVKELKLPNGYASNLGRCVNLNQGKLHGMKSYDYHVFMQQLLPIAFNSLPKYIWKPHVELSHFFRELTSTILNVEKLTIMEASLIQWIIFQFIYDMRLELVFLHSLKYKVKNKTRVEASICEAYLVDETSTFAHFTILIKLKYEGLGCLVIKLNLIALDAEIDHDILSKFPSWFKQYVGSKGSLLSKNMNSINHGVYVRGTAGKSESDFYEYLSDIIQLEYTNYPIMKLVLFKYNKAYDSFIFAQQAEQVYYTSYPKGHQGWLAAINTKVRSRIVHNLLLDTKQEALYQDDEFVGLQECCILTKMSFTILLLIFMVADKQYIDNY